MKFRAKAIVASVSLVFGPALHTPLSAQSRSPDLESIWAAAGFGAAIAIGDGEVFVGRTGGGVAGAIYPSPGSIHVFERGNDGWDFAYIIAGADVEIGDEFGAALAVDGDRLLVGSPGRIDGVGGAYIFERGSDGTWVQTVEFVPPADREIRSAGASVALSGDAVYLGAPSDAGPGAILRFDADGGSATLLASPVVSAIDRFGAALSLTGDLVYVGAPGTRDDRGAAYAFNAGFPATGPSPTTILALPDGRGGDAFGTSLAASGTSVLVGAPGADEGAGAALLFTRSDDGEWDASARLSFPESGPAGYGSAVAFDGRSVWVGASAVNQAAGSAQVFRVAETGPPGTVALEPQSTIPAPGFSRGALFGSHVALRDDVAVVAASNADMRLGAAVVFERGDDGWAESSTLRESTRTLTAVTGEEAPCTDGATGPFDCSQVDLVAFVPLASLGADPGTILNDIWGWSDPVTGRDWALVGRSDATAFVDVSDPANPRYAGELPLTEGATENLWRDIKVYADHAFIVADGAGAHGVQIFDLTQLRDASGPPVTFAETARYDGIASSHNIVINEETGMAYAVGSSMGGQTCGGGLHMIDVRTPAEPVFLGCFSDAATGRQRTGYSHDAQCVIYRGPDEDYQGREICFGANETALSIADVTDRDNPVAIARGEYPNVAYAHQGWLTEDHRHFFMGDEADEAQGGVDRTRTLIWDVADLDDPLLLKEHFAETGTIDHNQYVRGNRLYQANLMSGLRVLDISDVENPVEIGFFDTVPDDAGLPAFGGAWSNYPFFESGIVVVSSWSEGLFVLRPRGRPVS
ncbi:MAG: choice-of-anchor B family protein [Gemmatimonadetes bacterium]|nr:choice-of-anchor B family protein [Gemmatimonadota bacterium]MXX72805.1 choice-of-anchor B family protein [Gemmatimonadota bacterium]MYC91181.1 choice-of-anchor B family protein [Gemmatimonadota bacterium]MYG35746.1 choice-of-anchor B family protein [Gemmatimonadota bacterium]